MGRYPFEHGYAPKPLTAEHLKPWILNARRIGSLTGFYTWYFWSSLVSPECYYCTCRAAHSSWILHIAMLPGRHGIMHLPPSKFANLFLGWLFFFWGFGVAFSLHAWRVRSFSRGPFHECRYSYTCAHAPNKRELPIEASSIT